MSRRIENGNPNAPRPGMKRDAGFGTKPPMYERISLDGQYSAWYGAAPGTVIGNAYKWWSMTTRATAGSGTIVRLEEDACIAVDGFMDRSVPRQREENAGYTLAPDRLEYINGVLTIIDHSALWNRYFPTPEQIAMEPGSLGTVEAAPTGLGGFYLRRFKRHEDGSLREEHPDSEAATSFNHWYKQILMKIIGEKWCMRIPYTQSRRIF